MKPDSNFVAPLLCGSHSLTEQLPSRRQMGEAMFIIPFQANHRVTALLHKPVTPESCGAKLPLSQVLDDALHILLIIITHAVFLTALYRHISVAGNGLLRL